MDSPRDHRCSAIWQSLTGESRDELLAIARNPEHPLPSPGLVADIRRNGGMVDRGPWDPGATGAVDVIPADFLHWLNRALNHPGIDSTAESTSPD